MVRVRAILDDTARNASVMVLPSTVKIMTPLAEGT